MMALEYANVKIYEMCVHIEVMRTKLEIHKHTLTHSLTHTHGKNEGKKVFIDKPNAAKFTHHKHKLNERSEYGLLHDSEFVKVKKRSK